MVKSFYPKETKICLAMSKRKAETSFQSDSDEYSEDNYEDSVEKEVSENEEDINLSHDGKLFFILTNFTNT